MWDIKKRLMTQRGVSLAVSGHHFKMRGQNYYLFVCNIMHLDVRKILRGRLRENSVLYSIFSFSVPTTPAPENGIVPCRSNHNCKRTMSSFLAKKAAQSKASSLLEPLLSDDESSDDETSHSQEFEIEKQSPLQKLKTMTVYAVLTAGVGLSVAAMLISPMTLVFVAGGICCAK